jgi:hypothetical protein
LAIQQTKITGGYIKPLPPLAPTSPVATDSSGTTTVVVSIGNVTANAGTNLNTSLLALESGNIATIKSVEQELRRLQEKMYLEACQQRMSLLSGNRGFEIR